MTNYSTIQDQVTAELTQCATFDEFYNTRPQATKTYYVYGKGTATAFTSKPEAIQFAKSNNYMVNNIETVVTKGEGIEEFNDTYNKIKTLTEDRWIAELYSEYGSGLSIKQLDIVYNKAYNDGHACGHDEVAMYFSDFVDFAINILNAK